MAGTSQDNDITANWATTSVARWNQRREAVEFDRLVYLATVLAWKESGDAPPDFTVVQRVLDGLRLGIAAAAVRREHQHYALWLELVAALTGDEPDDLHGADRAAIAAMGFDNA